jgi:hypothetical protein
MKVSLNTIAILSVLILILFAGRNNSFAQERDIPTMDELAGNWLDADSTILSYPALNNTQGSAQAIRGDVLSIGKLSFPPVTMSGETGSMLVNDNKPELNKVRWYPYQVLRKGKAGNLEIKTAVRMLYEQKGLLFHIVVTNNGTSLQTFNVKLNLRAFTARHINWGWKIPREADTRSFSVEAIDKGQSILILDSLNQLSNCFSFGHKIDKLLVNQNSGIAELHITLLPKASEVINYVLVIGEKDQEAHDLALKCSDKFNYYFNKVEEDWKTRFNAMFTPGNLFFSGNLPVLVSSDKELKRTYYMSAISLLSVLRTGFPMAPRVYVSNTPESNCTMMYFWDTREWATSLALLDPVMMKQYLRSWLAKGIYTGYSEEYLTGSLQGVWYSANDYSVFILLNDYLNVTGDRSFLSEKINNLTVLDHMDSISCHWKSLVKQGRTLADYGEASNLLECVPTYINEVASFNAANVWMMRRVADIQESAGNAARAGVLRKDAESLLTEVLKLYIPGEGVWNALHKDGTKVQVRHIFDFATIGLTIKDDLTSKMQDEMTGFVERELITRYWMRAQSLSDPAAGVSDRPDHGPMGAFCAWPAETMAVFCEFGKYDKALDFLHKCTSTTYEGPFSQSRELLSRTFDAPVRIAERGTGGLPSQTYNASNGGSFGESVIRGFFGFKPDFLKYTLVPDKQNRGFKGELQNVRQGSSLYNIVSRDKGIQIIKVK